MVADEADPPDGGNARVAQHETFEIALVSPAPDAPLWPNQDVLFEVTYRGDLANPPHVTAVITRIGGETTRRPAGGLPAQQSRTFKERRAWKARDDAFKRAGRFEIYLEASIRATLTGSQPWTARTPSFYLELIRVPNTKPMMP